MEQKEEKQQLPADRLRESLKLVNEKIRTITLKIQRLDNQAKGIKQVSSANPIATMSHEIGMDEEQSGTASGSGTERSQEIIDTELAGMAVRRARLAQELEGLKEHQKLILEELQER